MTIDGNMPLSYAHIKADQQIQELKRKYARQGVKKMKEIVVKSGNKTTIKLVPDNYEETDDTICRDMTTSGRKSIGFSDVPKERWDSIFNKDKKDT